MDHIEYDINSFTGCSGGIVFLTDEGQPDSVDSCDIGKAVAIHSGSHPVIGDRNFGFIINRHPIMDYMDPWDKRRKKDSTDPERGATVLAA